MASKEAKRLNVVDLGSFGPVLSKEVLVVLLRLEDVLLVFLLKIQLEHVVPVDVILFEV